MIRRLLWCWLLLITGCNLRTPAPIDPTKAPVTPQARAELLVVAWVDNGNLMAWQTGDTIPRRIASGGVVQPFIAPDGRHIAFTRGPDGAPETLWVVDTLGTAEQELVGERPRNYTSGIQQIGDVAWLDESVLYFNTRTQSGLVFTPRDDLYRTHIRTREVAVILAATEGGRFHVSPDGQHIVVVSPGTYGQQDGRIAVLDPLKLREPRTLLRFIGIATGSEQAFYPPIHWLPDSRAVIAAIPDSNLVYQDTTEQFEVPLTHLWRLPIDNPSNREQLGAVQASFFGLPRWSEDGQWLTFLRRAAGTNHFTAYLAGQTGTDDRALYAGAAGTLEQPTWIPGSTDYVYPRVAPDGTVVYYISSIEREPQRLSEEEILLPKFVSADTYVYAAVGSGRVDMRVVRFGDGSQFIGSAGLTAPFFDAVLVR